MLIINNEIDLGKSFEYLKNNVLESERMLKDAGNFGYMAAYLNLKVSATSHIYNCTGEVVDFGNIPAANPDDIKDINI